MTAALERMFWLFVLITHSGAAIGWLWLAPGGFAVSHPRFWTNRAVPGATLAVVVAILWAAKQGRTSTLRGLISVLPAAWMGLGIVGRLVFPVTFSRLFIVPILASATLAAGTLWKFGREKGLTRRPLVLGLTIGAMMGGVVTFGFRPPPALTQPANSTPPPALAVGGAFDGRLSDRILVSPGDGSAMIRVSPMRIVVQPLLRFESRSPDGAPTVLVPASKRDGPGLRLIAAARGHDSLDLRYRSDYQASLHVEQAGDVTRMEATAELPETIWSHLNGYCDVEVSGHRRLSLSFSPCPDAAIEVQPMDYPVGRPLRFAFLDASGNFRVVEAQSGEKGPFRELASGRLRRGDPLGIELRDEGSPVATIVLDDWSAQVDVQPSPTAGWGVPANAIEFCALGEEPTSTASIFLSLASTSVGRGWDCLGHRAGVYRNRVQISATPQAAGSGR